VQQNLGFLFAAFAVTWLAFFAYLFLIQRMLVETVKRLRTLQRQPSGGALPQAQGEPPKDLLG
jgi:CcmD family protein